MTYRTREFGKAIIPLFADPVTYGVYNVVSHTMEPINKPF